MSGEKKENPKLNIRVTDDFKSSLAELTDIYYAKFGVRFTMAQVLKMAVNCAIKDETSNVE